VAELSWEDATKRINWDPLPDPNLANRIMKRAIELAPQLVKEGQGVEGLDIIRHGVDCDHEEKRGPRVERIRLMVFPSC